MPNAMALVGEFSPKRSRVATMMIVSNGFTAGAAVAGVVAAWMLPRFGWRSVFYVGGTIPLLLVIAMIVSLPESLQFLVLRRPHSVRLGRWLRKIDRAVVPVGRALQFTLPAEEKSGIPFLALFQDGRVAGTLLLWVINFMNLLNLYTLQNWIPTWATDAGYTPSTAALIGTMVQLGGAIGAFGLGWFVPKFGFIPVLATCSILACVNIAAIGQPFLTITFLFVVVFIAGICVVGGQAAINSLSATYYPTDLRSTGIGAGLGVGRLGAILGPSMAGFMLGHGWSGRDLFVAAAVPPMIAAVALFAWPALTRSGGRKALQPAASR
jgi:AAHS family 4-hydroxybenzoate transporter-like MFS transporter